MHFLNHKKFSVLRKGSTEDPLMEIVHFCFCKLMFFFLISQLRLQAYLYRHTPDLPYRVRRKSVNTLTMSVYKEE